MILKIDFEKAYDRVRWDFLEEVMKGKNFPSLWLSGSCKLLGVVKYASM